MIFSEIYSAYYNTAAAAIAAAQKGELTRDALYRIVQKSAFPESYAALSSALEGGKWALIKSDYSTNIKNAPSMPLSLLQKRWLKAILSDARFRLFASDDVIARLSCELAAVEPLFLAEDVFYYDQYTDGDPFGEESYIRVFRTALCAVREKKALNVAYTSRFGRFRRFVCAPLCIEYSQKDDKFRLIAIVKGKRKTLNMKRIQKCCLLQRERGEIPSIADGEKKSLTLELYDERKTLERAMLSFAHFEKSAAQTGENPYRLTLTYDSDDETELLIRVLSFGPTVKVLAPVHFRNLVKARLQAQLSLC